MAKEKIDKKNKGKKQKEEIKSDKESNESFHSCSSIPPEERENKSPKKKADKNATSGAKVDDKFRSKTGMDNNVDKKATMMKRAEQNMMSSSEGDQPEDNGKVKKNTKEETTSDLTKEKKTKDKINKKKPRKKEDSSSPPPKEQQPPKGKKKVRRRNSDESNSPSSEEKPKKNRSIKKKVKKRKSSSSHSRSFKSSSDREESPEEKTPPKKKNKKDKKNKDNEDSEEKKKPKKKIKEYIQPKEETKNKNGKRRRPSPSIKEEPERSDKANSPENSKSPRRDSNRSDRSKSQENNRRPRKSSSEHNSQKSNDGDNSRNSELEQDEANRDDSREFSRDIESDNDQEDTTLIISHLKNEDIPHEGVDVQYFTLNHETKNIIDGFLNPMNVQNKEWTKIKVEEHDEIERMDDNQISFTTTELNAESFNTFFHNYEITNSYEDYLYFDEKMNPLFEVDIPFCEVEKVDKSLQILNFVLQQIENQKITINNEEIQSEVMKFKTRCSKIESNSLHVFKITGIRSDVDICKRTLNEKFLKFYQSRTKIQYSEDIDPEINRIIEECPKTGCKIIRNSDRIIRIYSIVDELLKNDERQTITYQTAKDVRDYLKKEIKKEEFIDKVIERKTNDDFRSYYRRNKDQFHKDVEAKFIKKEKRLKEK